jgi:hypothetical protein
MSTNGINDIDSLKRHLQWALKLELSTIPPYLCALYSLQDGSNATIARLIRSVVMEEMLHMALVANLLNAIGGTPRLDAAEYVPGYPTFLPHSDDTFEVHLRPFGPEAIDTFLKIERPAKAGAPAEPDKFHTIGQFYQALKAAFKALDSPRLFVKGRDHYQVTGEQWYYGGGGTPIRVHDLSSARLAIDEIAHQGEGLSHSIFDGDREFGQVDELAHYFRFNEIRLERRYRVGDTPSNGPSGPELPVDWSAVYPMRVDPSAAQYKLEPQIHRVLADFNRSYTGMLLMLHRAFNGSPHLLIEAVPLMYDLKYKAQELMRIPTGDADGSTVGPSFEFAE